MDLTRAQRLDGRWYYMHPHEPITDRLSPPTIAMTITLDPEYLPPRHQLHAEMIHLARKMLREVDAKFYDRPYTNDPDDDDEERP